MKPVVGCSILLACLAVSTATPLSGTAGTGHAYVGNKKCKMCHLKEWTSWSTTKMARALDLLKPGARAEQKKAAGLDPGKDYTKDPQCLPCHTVGYAKPGGFVDTAATPDAEGVGCEMCHGPGGTYLQREYMTLQNKEFKRDALVAVGMVGKLTAETCTSLCHNEKSPFVGKGYVFDFEAKRDQGIHERFPLKYQH